MKKLLLSAGLGLCLAASACGGSGDAKKDGEVSRVFDPFPSTYTAYPSGATLITGATVLDGKGGLIEGGSVLIEGGKIAETWVTWDNLTALTELGLWPPNELEELEIVD